MDQLYSFQEVSHSYCSSETGTLYSNSSPTAELLIDLVQCVVQKVCVSAVLHQPVPHPTLPLCAALSCRAQLCPLFRIDYHYYKCSQSRNIPALQYCCIPIKFQLNNEQMLVCERQYTHIVKSNGNSKLVNKKD